jgi:hypothetical protein
MSRRLSTEAAAGNYTCGSGKKFPALFGINCAVRR